MPFDTCRGMLARGRWGGNALFSSGLHRYSELAAACKLACFEVCVAWPHVFEPGLLTGCHSICASCVARDRERCMWSGCYSSSMKRRSVK